MVIRKTLDYAVKMEYIPFNPAARIETPKKQKYIGDYYNQDELNQLFSVIKGDTAEVAIVLAEYYGLWCKVKVRRQDSRNAYH